MEVGKHQNISVRDTVSHTCSRPQLIYNVEAANISLHGREETTASRETRAVKPSRQPPFPHAYFSSAPLENVTTAYAFQDRESRFCAGFMLQYADGTFKTLGQCRLGLDKVIAIQKPLWVVYAAASYHSRDRGLLEGFIVHFSRSSRPGRDVPTNVSWLCHPMVGVLEVWLTGKRTRLNFV